MGEVYKAIDTRLDREVALKVSNERFSERFEREARVIASLNHPNICTLYDVGPNFLVMELVEGPTLAERIEQGAIPQDEALDIARQIADALEAAHEKGVVHRDLKPGNIKIKPDGAVKVLDFGLAKAGVSAAPDENSATVTIGETKAGMILGTAGYMSPEQARGKPVDKRADIWAFGVVLYEMFAGRRTFQGDTVTDLLAAVITQEPELERAPAKTRKLLRRCLEKDPKKRLRDIGDAMSLVEDAGAPAEPTAAPSSKLRWLPWALAGVPLLALAALAIVHFREKPPAPQQPVRFQIASSSLLNGNIFYMPISPDGRKLAYTAVDADGKPSLWVRDMDTLESRWLRGTENAVSPFWSADSRYIAFGVGTELKKVDSTGTSPPQTLCVAPNAVGMGSWNADGVIVFGGRGVGPLERISDSGGTPIPVTALGPEESYHTFPVFLPDGKHFLYLRAGSLETRGIYAGSLDVKPGEQSTKRIMASQLGVTFAPSAGGGRILFLRGGTLMSQPFDTVRLETTGEPVPIVERVAAAGSAGWFSVSANGVLAYRVGGTPGTYRLTWYDRKGVALSTIGDPSDYIDLTLSPDGTRLATSSASAQQDIWLFDLSRMINTRFTFDAAADRVPVWSPDGSKIVFSSSRKGRMDLYLKPSNGAVEEQLLLASQEGKFATSWSRDGRFLLYTASVPKRSVWLLPMDTAGGQPKPIPLLQAPFNNANAVFSPDMKWIAYQSDETGRF
jgi:Tol biopolymer transport system component